MKKYWPANKFWLGAALWGMICLACTQAPRYHSGIKEITAPPSIKGFVQEGYASFYGQKYHQKRTASGEIFDMYSYTAAHRSLPFQTRLKITNLENNRQVTVRINDRGPFVKNRIVDLSYQAAKQLDMLSKGIAKVRLEVIE
ncbi:MAG: septal ring lytic transglycosylase RlpA family protein [Candidatus Delongbacteria bacterium]|nr:septal ring lytic transglycosylase RlpA family protein [Candidatus Delongbacteria bacterium]